MISVVIPVYNEEEILPELHRRVSAAAAAWGEAYEVIAVDDGSTDGTTAMLRDVCSRDARWRALILSRNFGHQVAVSAGIHHARGDAVAVMDGDLQDPPEEVGRFLERWREGYDVVYAVRTKRKENVLKRAAYHAFYRLLRHAASIDIPLDAGDFCVMDRAVVDVLKSMPERTRFVRGLRSWAGFRQIGVTYERAARGAGRPKYTLAKLIRLAVDGIFSFSTMPLKLANVVGILLCGFSLLLVAGVIAWRITDVPILAMHPTEATGWASIMCTVLFLSGLQFLLIGILGEYVARIFTEVKGRPTWIVARAFGTEEPRAESRERRAESRERRAEVPGPDVESEDVWEVGAAVDARPATLAALASGDVSARRRS